MFGKKKKEAVRVDSTPEELIDELMPEREAKEPEEKPKNSRKTIKKEAKEEPEEEQEETTVKEAPAPTTVPAGKFTLTSDQMALAVNALAGSEEFKLYRQMVIGQQIAEIIEGYNQAIQTEMKEEKPDEELPQ